MVRELTERCSPPFRYVKLVYRPVRSLETIEARLMAATRHSDNNDFVELLMYNKREGVLMTGTMTDGGDHQGVVNRYRTCRSCEKKITVLTFV